MSLGDKLEDFRAKNGAFGEDVHNSETVAERLKVEFLKEGSFGVTDLLALSGDLELLGDFNLTLLNLSRDGQSMEERNLGWIHTSWARSDSEVEWRNHTNTSSSRSSVAFNQRLNLKHWLVGEDKTNLLFAQVGELIESSELLVPEWLSEFIIRIFRAELTLSEGKTFSEDGLKRRRLDCTSE